MPPVSSRTKIRSTPSRRSGFRLEAPRSAGCTLTGRRFAYTPSSLRSRLWAADGAEQHRVGIQAARERGGRQRIAELIDGGAPEWCLLKRELMAVASRAGLQHAQRLGDHLRTDAIAREYGNASLHDAF